MQTAGRISIIDLSDMDAPYPRNIVIAQILRRIQSCQEEKYAIHMVATLTRRGGVERRFARKPVRGIKTDCGRRSN